MKIEIPVAMKRPGAELTDSVKFVLAVDRQYIEQIAQWSVVGFDQAFKVTIEEIEDPDKPAAKPFDFKNLDPETKKRRKKKYDQVRMICQELGYTEDYRKDTQQEVTGYRSMTEMPEDKLDELILYLEAERANLATPEQP